MKKEILLIFAFGLKLYPAQPSLKIKQAYDSDDSSLHDYVVSQQNLQRMKNSRALLEMSDLGKASPTEFIAMLAMLTEKNALSPRPPKPRELPAFLLQKDVKEESAHRIRLLLLKDALKEEILEDDDWIKL